MDNWKTEFDKLADERLEYVKARVTTKKDAEALRQSGVSRNTFYSWDQSERDYLNEIAQSAKRDVATLLMVEIEGLGYEAVGVLRGSLKSRDERLRVDVAKDVLTRLGITNERAKVELSGKNGEDLTFIFKERSA